MGAWSGQEETGEQGSVSPRPSSTLAPSVPGLCPRRTHMSVQAAADASASSSWTILASPWRSASASEVGWWWSEVQTDKRRLASSAPPSGQVSLGGHAPGHPLAVRPTRVQYRTYVIVSHQTTRRRASRSHALLNPKTQRIETKERERNSRAGPLALARLADPSRTEHGRCPPRR